jgi:type IV pilus assembly protein PilB
MAERKKLGDLLKESGLITEEQIVETLQVKRENQKLGDALVDQGFITERQLLEVLEIHLGIEAISLYNYPIDEELKELVNKEFARENILLPIKQQENTLIVAMSDPLDFYAIEDIELATGYNVRPVIATRDDILQAINQLYDMDESFDEDELSGEEAPAVRLLDQILESGVTLKASDIHIDPGEETVRVRYRVDGALRTERTLPKSILNAIVARLKILADLNITESRLPQDGRIRMTVSDKHIDLRVSTLPTVFGEKVVIRILDLSNVDRRLEDLGLADDTLETFRQLIRQPSGLVLITGPTGSGKTSTLYGGINELNRPEVNIITVEDPVEYQLEGVNQVQVHADIGLTFAAGLRSILRQDPNIIMVGEIRDRETAEIAIRSSLTGHMVFSTLHTNSAIAAIPRLFDMGVEPYLVVSSLAGVMAQRLVKRICKDCGEERGLTPMEKEVFEKHGIEAESVTEGKGCNSCRFTGYRGRVAIHELIEVDDEIKHMMMNQQSMDEVRRYVKQKGVRFLIDDGLIKVAKGMTSLDEVLSVAQG